ncbi:hypothetical protein BdWA1_003116 [Babesia duncani]|uniref:Origin recognition complex subunit 1 n=1 Tax=Babesia duncani TaxID=323732 RepID=A0AAD9PIF3_9APIC|nr:hypothetical protein BdWA1_003116 [Babesia duncani]
MAANSPKSNLVLVAVSNNIELATKITVKHCKKLMFAPYTSDEIMKVITNKLNRHENVKSVLTESSMMLMARRVANTMGDLRACLDAFTRAISESHKALQEKHYTRLESASTACSIEYGDEYSVTPDRKKCDIDLKDYRVGHQDISRLTPTLSFDRHVVLKNQLSYLPSLELLVLLAACNVSITCDSHIVPIDTLGSRLFVLAEKVGFDTTAVQSFYNEKIYDALDTFQQIGIFAKGIDIGSCDSNLYYGVDDIDNDQGDSRSQEQNKSQICFRADPREIAKLVLDSTIVFSDLSLEDDIETHNTTRPCTIMPTLSKVQKRRRTLKWLSC